MWELLAHTQAPPALTQRVLKQDTRARAHTISTCEWEAPEYTALLKDDYRSASLDDQTRPKPGQSWSMLANVGPSLDYTGPYLTEFGPKWFVPKPMFVKFGQYQADFGRNRATERCRAKLDRCRAKSGRVEVRFGRSRSIPDQCWRAFGNRRSSPSQCW